jgi:type IV secretory pathway VirB10-like protein
MKLINIFVVAVAVGAGGLIAYQYTTKANDAPPVNASPAKAESAFPPPLTTVATETQPKPPTPATTPKPLPPTIVKQLAAARALAPSRPMTQLEKSWFGCASEDAYKTTMGLIEQKNPSSADHFKGSTADCAPLPTGTHITVLHINDASDMAQISTNDTHQVYWTDTAVLGGELKN